MFFIEEEQRPDQIDCCEPRRRCFLIHVARSSSFDLDSVLLKWKGFKKPAQPEVFDLWFFTKQASGENLCTVIENVSDYFEKVFNNCNVIWSAQTTSPSQSGKVSIFMHSGEKCFRLLLRIHFITVISFYFFSFKNECLQTWS